MDKRTVIAALDKLREQLEELLAEALQGAKAAAAAVGEAQSVAYLRGRGFGLMKASELLHDLTEAIEKGWTVEANPVIASRVIRSYPSERFGVAILSLTNGEYILRQSGFNQYPVETTSDGDAIRVAAAVVHIRERLASSDFMRMPKPTNP